MLSTSDKLAHLVLVPNPEHNPEGDFAIEHDLLSNRATSRFTFSGVACYKKSFFSDVIKGKQALAPLLRQQAERQGVSAELYFGQWSDVGTVERLQSLQSP